MSINQPKEQTVKHTEIYYNNDLEQLLAQSAEECESLGILHLASYEKYNKLSNIINIPVIILSSGIGFITGIDLNYDKMNIILGIGSVFVGIIKSIDSYFQLGKRAESHRMCALQYTQINKKIQIELSLCREQRQTAKDMLSIIKTDIKNLQDISPVIDQEIIKEYNLKYGKYKNVKKPNFVNGLSSVKVNANSLEQELASASARSIPQSIQSGAPSRASSVNGDNNSQQVIMGKFNRLNENNGGYNGNNFENNYLDSNIENLNDVSINIPFQNSRPYSLSQPHSRSRSPPPLPPSQNMSNYKVKPSSNSLTPTPTPSASAQLMFAKVNTNTNTNNMNNNSIIRTPVSSSPISSFRLQGSNNDAAHLSTPQLLTSFQGTGTPSQLQSQQQDNSQNEINFIIDIPDNSNDNNESNNPDNSGADVDDPNQNHNSFELM
jgi:hypothetical protein